MMMGAFGSVLVLPWLLLARLDWDNMDAVPTMTATPAVSAVTVEVRDRAGMFDPVALQHAQDIFRRIHREHGVPVLIETIESLDGVWIADVARRRDQFAGPDRLFILLAERERKVGVIAASSGPASRLTDQQRESIRQAFLGPLEAGDEDGALEQGALALVAAIDSEDPSRPGFSGRDVVIGVTILVAAVAILIACNPRKGPRFRLRRANRSARPGGGAADDAGLSQHNNRIETQRIRNAET